MTKSITTVIHKLSAHGRCVHCAVIIPEGHHARIGEYVGIVTYAGYLTNPGPSSYRIGVGNKDNLCTGEPCTAFTQKSVEQAVKA